MHRQSIDGVDGAVRLMPRNKGMPAVAERKRIECVTLEPGSQARIAAIGGTESSAIWKMSEAEAIKVIDQERFCFYVIVGGSAREVIVGEYENRRYLKTDGDHRIPNHLLALPSCPTEAEV